MNDFNPVTLIRCDAGIKHGLGHLRRCLALARALQDQGTTPVFICYDPQDIAAPRIRESGFTMYPTTGNVGESADTEFVLDMLGDNFGILVFDSVNNPKVSFVSFRHRGLTVVLDDAGSGDLSADVLVNSNIWASRNDYSHNADCQFFLGVEANLIPSELFAMKPPARNREKLNVLITFGGEDPFNHTSVVMEHLSELLIPARVTIILGPAHPDPDFVVRRASELLPDSECVINPCDISHYIIEADIAITAGGTTCYELAVAGVPMLGVAIEPHQQQMIESMSRSGSLAPLSDDQVVLKEVALSRSRELFQSQRLRQDMSQAALKLFPGPGADYLAKKILSTFYLKCENHEH